MNLIQASIWTVLSTSLIRKAKEEEGQTIVEYALLIVLVGLAVAVASPSVTDAVLSVFSAASSSLAIPTAS